MTISFFHSKLLITCSSDWFNYFFCYIIYRFVWDSCYGVHNFIISACLNWFRADIIIAIPVMALVSINYILIFLFNVLFKLILIIIWVYSHFLYCICGPCNVALLAKKRVFDRYKAVQCIGRWDAMLVWCFLIVSVWINFLLYYL